MENKIRLLEKAQKEIERYEYYLNNDIPIADIQKIREYIENNEHLIKLYGIENPIDLSAMYLKEVRDLRRDLNAKQDYQYLANVLEYFRFMCTRENINGVIPGIAFFENLSDSKFSSLLLGKANPEGQIAAMSDVLSNRLNTSMCNAGYYIPDATIDPISRYTCLTVTDETGKHYVDAYRYNSKMELNPGVIEKNYIDDIFPLVLDDRTLRKAKKKVSSYLIKKLNIEEIISSLNLEGLTEKEKNDKLIEYIKNNQDDYGDIRINANTIVVNGHLLEVSRLLELFYIATKIRYRVADTRKENSTFEVILDDESTFISLDAEKEKTKIKATK